MEQKKFKVFLTVVSAILLLVFTCGMYVFYDYDVERNIAINAKNQSTERFILEQFSGSYGAFLTNPTSDIANYRSF